MQDRSVSLGTVVAWGLWLAVVALLLTAAIAESILVANIACATSAAAATATIRGYFCNYNRDMRNAFNAGRDHNNMRAL